MSDDEAIWYLPGNSGQPAGPYTAATILAKLLSGECDKATLCWREGMPDWQPVATVHPFAGELAQRTARARRRVAQLFMVVLILGGLGVGGYFLLTRGGPGVPPSNHQRDEQIVRQLEANCNEIFYGSTRPFADFNEFLADDYTFVKMSDGSVQEGKEASMRLLKESQSEMQRSYRSYTCRPTILLIRFVAGAAVVDKKNLFEGVTRDGKPIAQEAWHTNIWCQTRRGWRLAQTIWYGEPSVRP